MEATIGSSVRVFDGTTDFRVWRARVENELMRYHLLGYVMVRGYDGSQSFTYNGEVVPPRTSIVIENDEQQQPANLKEEPSCATIQRGRLSRWDILGESAEAKSILQRFLHPDVESAILNKNIYDSWTMLCTIYGNRSSPGAHDMYEMHRVIYHIRLGDKKGEPVKEFITRWEMLIQQYALATGIELTDAFRSVTLTQTLPSAWRPMVASWRGVRPFVPYAELVEKVVATRERIQEQAESSKTPTALKASSSSTSISNEAHTPRSAERAAADQLAIVKPLVQAITKPVSDDKPALKQTSKVVKKQPDKPIVETSISPDKSARFSEKASSIDASTGRDNTLDLRTEQPSVLEKKSSRSPCSRDNSKKPSSDRGEKTSSPRSYRNSKASDDKSEKHHTRDKHDSEKGYASHSRYDRSPRTSRSRYSKNSDSIERIDKIGPVSCFYCLKVGHHMKHCWYLKADIESGTTHEPRKRYTCAVTAERNEYMVCCLEAYIDEVNRERAARRTTKSTTSTSRRGDYELSESERRSFRSQQQDLALPPPPGQPPVFAFRDQQQPSNGSTATDYRKRSRSVFPSAISPRDPRLNRSNSVYRSTDVAEEFSPRKRGRTPSFERHLQAYY